MDRSSYGAIAPVLAVALLGWSAGAHAETAQDSPPAFQQLQEEVAAQAARLADQEKRMAEQRAALDRQDHEIARLRAFSDQMLQLTRGMGMKAPDTGPIATLVQAVPVMGATPSPVGVAPPVQERVEVAAVPEGAGVMTPRGHWVLEPSIDYTHGSSNRLVFRGVEIVTGIQIGVIEANEADRSAVSGAIDLRYGLGNRIEIEGRVPYVYRSDRVTTLTQRDQQVTQTFHLDGKSIGDIELAARYQINSGAGGWPVFLAGLRVKSDTGTSPFEIERDEFGVSSELATGSGFWGAEASLTFLYPTDPIVIFGGVSYFDHLPKTINKTIGGVLVGRVDPGDSIGASVGFGFALNPRFSFSLGYKHNYIFPTKSELGATRQRTESLQVGAFTFGWSFQINDRITLSNAYEVGTTRDSPDMRVVFRFPIRF